MTKTIPNGADALSRYQALFQIDTLKHSSSF